MANGGLLTRRELRWLGNGEHDADLSPVLLSDDRRLQYRKVVKQYLASLVIVRWKRIVYKRKRPRIALQYLTAFRFLDMSRETLANISEFM